MAILELTKITSKGQVVIPKEIRDSRQIKEGEKFLVYDTHDSIVLKRIKNAEKVKNMEEFDELFKSTWVTAKRHGITRKDVEAEIQAYRREKR